MSKAYSAEEIIKLIADALDGMPGDEIASIANLILDVNVEYIEDSLFNITN